MKTPDDIKKILRNQKPFLAKEFGIREIGIFGSYVRNEARYDSDLDILIEFDPSFRIGMIGFARLEQYFSKLFEIKADITVKKNLRKRIKQHVLNEVTFV